MIIDQSEIDALLEQADTLVTETKEQVSAPASPPDAPRPATPPPPPSDPDIARILKLQVPVLVQLASRFMPIMAVRDLSLGAIIEFEKCVDDELNLLVNNHTIGQGQCVKIGENFGLRISRICSKTERIQSLGSS